MCSAQVSVLRSDEDKGTRPSQLKICKWKPAQALVQVAGAFYVGEVLCVSRSESGSLFTPGP